MLDSDLKNEVCAVGVGAKPIETPKFTVLPLKKEPTRFNDPVKVLRYANLLAREDAAPRETVKVLGKHLPTEAVTVMEPDRNLNRAEFSPSPDPGPNEAVGDLNIDSFSARPMPEESEPPKDLKNEDFSAKPEFMFKEPLSDRNSDVCLAKVVVSVHAELKDLKSEDCLATAEDALREVIRDS
ncbi:hypothetical protein E6H36_01640 [Candidatus Bathyarchaeota archaeon]|nr:MAG: hypothetical protein E6H36_01640 [Candidatus Bathyarchaeota archaeon]TMI31065.1 MAG: hypothetical protein E6H29_06585 [Candidatus Bathyarchaeota archaeon]